MKPGNDTTLREKKWKSREKIREGVPIGGKLDQELEYGFTAFQSMSTFFFKKKLIVRIDSKQLYSMRMQAIPWNPYMVPVVENIE